MTSLLLRSARALLFLGDGCRHVRYLTLETGISACAIGPWRRESARALFVLGDGNQRVRYWSLETGISACAIGLWRRESARALLVLGDGSRSKMTFVTCYKRARAEVILVACVSAYSLAATREIQPRVYGFPYCCKCRLDRLSGLGHVEESHLCTK